MHYLPNLLIPPAVLSVSGLTSYLQSLLEQDEQLVQVWLTGEVSSAYRHRSGLFFTLQDPDEDATIQCVAWNAYLDKLTILPEAGELIIVLGKIRVFPQRGQYQLAVWQILPAGEGLRSLRYQQLRNRLEAEGLFNPQHKQPLPIHPRIIGVVTSPQAAAWGDIQRTLKSRYPGLKVLFSPSLVQGEQAPESVVKAIQRIEADGRAEVLILARGGGASEDLACFNDERIVRAIAACRIPVISGIGHQRDETLADLVADCFAHTPTAAASQAVPALSDLYTLHQDRQARLYQALSQQQQAAQQALNQQRQQLQNLRLNRLLQREALTLAAHRHQLVQSVTYHLRSQQQRHQFLKQELASLDPRDVLQRGYAIARTLEGKIVRRSSTLQPGDVLRIQLGEGQLQVKVMDAPASIDLSQDKPL
jgi:exodeoxyribonuclease VII large subunit